MVAPFRPLCQQSECAYAQPVAHRHQPINSGADQGPYSPPNRIDDVHVHLSADFDLRLGRLDVLGLGGHAFIAQTAPTVHRMLKVVLQLSTEELPSPIRLGRPVASLDLNISVCTAIVECPPV